MTDAAQPVDRPIIFSGPMVQALLAGRKTMTRRLATSPLRKCQPGDRLWVRESFSSSDPGPVYRADHGDEATGWGWTPSIHMPRKHSRLTLIVNAVKFERLQDINGLDALAEGITREEGVSPWRTFLRLCNSLHGEGAWQANPEIVALSFTVIRSNIDAVGYEVA